VVGVAGTMARNDKPTAAAITRALVNAAEWTYRNPDEAAVVFGPYAPKQKVEDLATMLRDYEHHHHPTGDDFRAELATYVQELKEVNVIGPKTDPQKFSHRIYADVLG
jgi:NitT/TauT family transport system substrate-binding protein